MTVSFIDLVLPAAPASAAAARTRSALRSHQRIAVVLTRGPLRALQAGDDVGHDFGVRLEFRGLENFRVRAVRNAKAQHDGLQLLVDVEPRALTRFDGGQRPKQRVDGRRLRVSDLRAPVGRLRAARTGRLRLVAARRVGLLRSAAVAPLTLTSAGRKAALL